MMTAMLAELGQFSLVLALLLALCLSVLPLLASYNNQPALQSLVRPLSYGLLGFVAFAFGILTCAFIQQDFSIAYVAHHSNSLLPLKYRISAVWGAHEGSLLLWSLILALWTAAVSRFSNALPLVFVARVGSVLGLVAVGFLLFILFTSNPFIRLLPAAIEGADLNPLLQDPGLIIHPPLLYFGYVGFAVPFAFAIAALLGGDLQRGWVRWCRPWALTAWSLLTGGIALGSWWAYYELGWGGWWFWDPVENASFMPWLIGTALIHSLAVTEKRQVFYNWSLLLCILAFSLSLLGTFLVRSGVITSVHAFASDPARGIFILMLLAFFCGGGLLLYALRAHTIKSPGNIKPYSREVLLLINNVFFSTSAAMVLLGTLFPLLMEAFGGGKISVGPPYFGLLFTLLMVPIIILIPTGPLTRWQKGDAHKLWQQLRLPFLFAIIIAAVAVWLYGNSTWKTMLGLSGALWLFFGTGMFLYSRIKQNARLQRWELGMAMAHIGVGIFVVGVTMVETRQQQLNTRLSVGDSVQIDDLTVTFNDSNLIKGPNYQATRGTFDINTANGQMARLIPEKRRYLAGGNIMTEASIHGGITRDIYVALGEPLDDGSGINDAAQTWSVRVYIKPYIRWIWFGALAILLGGLLAASDRRYRHDHRPPKKAVYAS